MHQMKMEEPVTEFTNAANPFCRRFGTNIINNIPISSSNILPASRKRNRTIAAGSNVSSENDASSPSKKRSRGRTSKGGMDLIFLSPNLNRANIENQSPITAATTTPNSNVSFQTTKAAPKQVQQQRARGRTSNNNIPSNYVSPNLIYTVVDSQSPRRAAAATTNNSTVSYQIIAEPTDRQYQQRARGRTSKDINISPNLNISNVENQTPTRTSNASFQTNVEQAAPQQRASGRTSNKNIETNETSPNLIPTNVEKQTPRVTTTTSNVTSETPTAAPKQQIQQRARGRTEVNNVSPNLIPTNVDSQNPAATTTRTLNVSFETPTATQTQQQRARERTSKKSDESVESSERNSSSKSTPRNIRNRITATFFDGTPKVIIPEIKTKKSDGKEKKPRKSRERTQAKQSANENSVASFLTPSTARSRTFNANVEVPVINASNQSLRSRSIVGRSRTRTNKAAINYDCKIEGEEKTFDVNRELLSEKSLGFQALFEANKDEEIEIEGIPDKTMEMAIDFCHGFSLKDLNYPETFSLLFYANVWEIADLKNLLEGRLTDKMGPSNVVNIANAALAGNCGYFQSTCKEYIIRYLKTGKIVRSYASLSEKLCKEIVELLKGD